MCLPGTVETVRARIAEEGAPPLAQPRVSRRAALLAGAGAALAASVPGSAAAHGRRGGGHDRGRGHGLTDLTWEFSEDFALFPGAPPNSRRVAKNYTPDGFYAQQWTMYEHSGTHIDAPAHFIPGGRFTPQLTLDELVGPVAVIDISRRAASDPDAVVTLADLRRWERRHGRLPEGAVVCMYSGWESRAGDPARYLNDLHFPGFSGEAANWAIDHRDARGIGVDTLSLDPGVSADFAAHFATLGADRFGIENLRNLAALPPSGATLYVGVIPWREGSGGPARVFAAH